MVSSAVLNTPRLRLMTFGKKLKELRKAGGLSLHALAEAAAVPKATLTDYEADKRIPAYPVVVRLCDALGQDCNVFKDCEFINTSKKDKPDAEK